MRVDFNGWWRELFAYVVLFLGFGFGMVGFQKFRKSQTDSDMYDGVTAFAIGCVVMGAGFALRGASRAREALDAVTALNPLPGKSLSRICRKLGEPQIAEELPNGEIVRTWRLPGRNLSLAFSPQDVCTRVAREEVTAV